VNSEEENLIKACLKGKAKAQRALYDKYCDGMFVLCLRYASVKDDAEDILQEGFIKVFKDLKDYKPIAPLGAWMRRVMINTALQHIRKNKNQLENDSDNILHLHNRQEPVALDKLKADDLLYEIRSLPEAYRSVFNLYAIEGYSHREIAEMLSISVANSKVRLNRARGILRSRLEKMDKSRSNES
jgi:RNA polymerase sigma-70 factor (ECF subfamily)